MHGVGEGRRVDFLADGGETGALIRAHDWSATPLGPIDGWPPHLRTAVALMLASPFPSVLAWGPALTTLHNDAYRPLLGGRPHALGVPYPEVLAEGREAIAPLLDRAFAGEACRFEEAPLTLRRRGWPEPAYFDFAFSPVPDDDGTVAGVLNTAIETTGRVLGERRQAFRVALDARLRDLGDPAEAIAFASEALGRHLGVGQVGYAEVEPGDEFVAIQREWNDGSMLSNAGRHRLDDYGPTFIADLRRGRTVTIGDVRLDPRTASPEALASFGAAGLAAFVNAPLIKSGRLVAVLAVHSASPRHWAAEDVALAEEVAERIWAAAERVRAEAALRESEARQRYRVELGDALRPLVRAAEIQAEAARRLGAHLRASRVHYAEIEPDGEHAVVPEDIVIAGRDSTVPKRAGRYRLADFATPIGACRAGRSFVAADLSSDPRLAAAERATYAALPVAAMVVVPLVKDGRLAALLAVHRDAPHAWTAGEIALIEETAERTWAAIERARAEAAEREAAARFQAALKAAELGSFEWDLRTDAVALDERAREIFGFAPGEGTTAGDVFRRIHPADFPNVRAQARASERLRSRLDIEYRIVLPDGAVRIVRCISDAVSGSDGAAGRMVGVFDDATERRRAEIGRGALAGLGAATLDLGDPAGLSYAAAEILGRALGIGRAGYATVDHDAETAHIDCDWTASGTGTAVGTVRLRDFGALVDDLKRGEAVAIADVRTDPRTAAVAGAFEAWGSRALVKAPILERGRLVAVLYADHGEPRRWHRDELDLIRQFAERTRAAVERIRNQAALRDLNATLEQRVAERTAERDRIWAVSSDLLGVANAEGDFLSTNPAWAAVLGWTADELRAVRSMDLVHPDDRAATAAGLRRLAADGDTLRLENRYRTRDGGYRWLSWTAVQAGGLIYAVGRDVTAETERQAELEQAQEALRQAQKMEAVGQLTGGVAHDFNNMLTVIKGSTALLRRPGLAEERRRRYVDAISDTVDRAAKLTGQLLAFARRQALKPEVFDVPERVRALGDMLRTIVGGRIRIVMEIACEGCLAEADVTQFETALVNMAVNARDAMEGEGVLRVRVEASGALPGIRGQPGRAGAFVAVSLADTGTGIAADRLSQIFEPFYTTKEVGKGTGLGLSQVYGFAKQTGGDVDVASEPGQGATFTLYLPRVEGEAAERSTSGGLLEGDEGGGRRVLVVEDNVEVGTFSTQLLHDLGYETAWAANADEALALLAQSTFDVVFTDVMMPGMSGVELGKLIRRRHPGLPVVLTSGYSHVLADEGRHGFELLQKPYAVEELSRVLHRVARPRGD
ncbi:MAG TPA: GAF domain-containing protein [Alphaproteobacteria bacterium]|nr:GAF domain-containing protein [Alphaproteobacteria bacterium]